MALNFEAKWDDKLNGYSSSSLQQWKLQLYILKANI